MLQSLFHCFFTAPYWNPMNSSVSYGQFPRYVTEMKNVLESWSDPLFHLSDLVSVFEDFLFDSRDISNFIAAFSSTDKSKVLSAFPKISSKCFEVFQRQLSDFLDGGIFEGPLSDEVQSVLNTCPLTNLVGERMFGDLDFDMVKRRHASTHLRSTINMWKHNKTSSWLGRQNRIKVTKLLSVARTHRADWRQ